jgi:uncharacterized repeat protein (TIGR03803 family)
MKKNYLLTAVLLSLSLMVNSQGIYQFWGISQYGGSGNAGVIFSTKGDGLQLQNRYNIPLFNPGGGAQYTEMIAWNNKLYGMTSQGGSNSGVLFEYDPATNVYTTRVDFVWTNGGQPYGSLTLYNNKFYGMTTYGGTNGDGVLFEFDPATNIYTKKRDFDPYYTNNGGRPFGSLTVYNDKLYGMTKMGGGSGYGVLFEYDPLSNVYTKKQEFNGTNGGAPVSQLTLYNSKLYGLTTTGGSYSGVIFEYDPVANSLVKKLDLNNSTGYNPQGYLTVYNNKMYGTCSYGGSYGNGVLFEYDPAINGYVRKVDFNYGSNGYFPVGSLTVKNAKLYGTNIYGGASNNGVLFEFDPASSAYTKKADFSPATGKNPFGAMTLFNGKLYGLTSDGGSNNAGTLFEFDEASSLFTKKLNLASTPNGNASLSSLVLYKGNLYGLSRAGGAFNNGVLFKFDPATGSFTNILDFDGVNGSSPYGGLTAYNDRLYGVTLIGGTNGNGVLFEYDPATNVYTKKLDFPAATADGNRPYGSLTLYNGKLYGLCYNGGWSSSGVLFEYDPAINTYLKKADFDGTNGANPKGTLTVYNNKLYGMSQGGGSYGQGTLFEYDPIADLLIKKGDFNSSDFYFPGTSLRVFNDKLYSTGAYGGNFNKGAVFEYDPATELMTKKQDFDGAGNGSNPQAGFVVNGNKLYCATFSGGANAAGTIVGYDPLANTMVKLQDFTGPATGSNVSAELIKITAPVAAGQAGSCTSFATITIDNSNNNVWVPIVDNSGNAVAEIKANGNNLGIVTVQAYINGAAVREDGIKRLYLDRNLTISPQVQPSSPVDIRLYIKGAEFLALKNAMNSMSQPSGIATISDVGIFKNNNSCQSAIDFIANPVTTAAAAWEMDYVLTASISSFSSFYFANKNNTTLPLTLLSFEAFKQGGQHLLNWKTVNEINTKNFFVERSNDGIQFSNIGIVAAKGSSIASNIYSFADVQPLKGNNYYRLKMMDMDGRYSYGPVRLLQSANSIAMTVIPNPSIDRKFNISWNGQVESYVLLSIEGKILRQSKLNSNNLQIQVQQPGIYFIRLINKDGTTQTGKLIAY